MDTENSDMLTDDGRRSSVDADIHLAIEDLSRAVLLLMRRQAQDKGEIEALSAQVRRLAERPGPVTVQVKVLPNGEGLPLPAYVHEDDSGMDLRAAIPDVWKLQPGSQRIIPTGLSVAIPPGYEIQVRSRSGLAGKEGVFVLNSPGTIDPGYRDEVGVILMNTTRKVFEVKPGDRIAQAVLAKVERAHLQQVEELPPSFRGKGGFGSTGTS